jgi:ATP adenylyltransferase/5',5'''-P-1,P-4-tetraphosphate phosphorylase II
MVFAELPPAESLFFKYQQFISQFPGPDHNVLITKQWMLVVPRRHETWQGISGNAVAFSGCILVPLEAQLQTLMRSNTVRTLLSELGFPNPHFASH